MNNLVTIEEESLYELKKLYEVDKPLHVATTVAIGHFIKRFEKKPRWKEMVQFMSLDDNWRQTGTFVMVNGHDDVILFNTLEPAPYESLHKTLDLLHYDKPMSLEFFREIFRPIVLDVIRKKDLEITIIDVGYRNFYFNMETARKIEAPPGFYFDSLDQRHVDQMNSAWLWRDSTSYDYLSNCVAHNPSTGLFNKENGELVAWNVQHETGAAGTLEVIEKYRRKGFGELVTLKQGEKMGKVGKDITGYVSHSNTASINLMTTNGVQWVGNAIYLRVQPKSVKLIAHL